jgi:hypothetical protein
MEDRGIIDAVSHFGESSQSSLPFPEEMLAQFNEHSRREFIRNGRKRDQADAWAVNPILQTWGPTKYEGEPRWAMGTVEANYPMVNGSHEWTANQVRAELNAQLIDYVGQYKSVDADWPEFPGMNRLDEYIGEVAGMMTPGNVAPAFLSPTWRALMTILEEGDISKFPYDVYHDWMGPDGPEIRSTVTPETNRYVPDEGPLKGQQVSARYLEYKGRDGAYHMISELPGFDNISKVFYYDMTRTPEYAEQKRKEAEISLRANVRNLVRLGADETAVRAMMQERGFEDATLSEGLHIHDLTDFTEMQRQLGDPRKASKGPVRGVPHSELPPFNRAKWLSENPP